MVAALCTLQKQAVRMVGAMNDHATSPRVLSHLCASRARAIRSLIRSTWLAFLVIGTCLSPNMALSQSLVLQETRRLAPVESPAVAFDSVRGVIVRFGGTPTPANATMRSDTWEWDGRAWQFRSWLNPGFFSEAVMCFDSRRGVAVLHGGTTASASSFETWEWDGRA